jgi:hypothetical protein
MSLPADRRFLISRGLPLLASLDHLEGIAACLWGRCLSAGSLVPDSARPVRVDQATRTAWAAAHWPEEVARWPS